MNKPCIEEKPNKEISDITLYCLSFCLSTKNRKVEYLENFVLSPQLNPNARWFKIVEVDVDVKKLKYTNKSIQLKIRHRAVKNKEYIQNQFKERLDKHYKSITGFSDK